MEFWMSLEDLRKTSKCISIDFYMHSPQIHWDVFDMFFTSRSMSKELLKANSGLSSRIVSMMPLRASAKTARDMTEFSNVLCFYALRHFVLWSDVCNECFCWFTGIWRSGDPLKFSRMEEIYNGSYLSKAICESPQRARGQLNLKERSCGAIHLRHNHPVFTVFSCIWEIVVCFNRCGFAEEQE